MLEPARTAEPYLSRLRSTATRIELTDAVKQAAMAALIGALPKQGNRDTHCRLPDHEDSTESMSVSADAQWYCHACGTGGDVVGLIAAKRRLDPRADFRRIAAEVIELAKGAEAVVEEAPPTNVFVPTPKDELRLHARVHEYITERSISVRTAQAFGYDVGFDAKGSPYLAFDITENTSVRRFLDGASRYKIVGSSKELPLLGPEIESPARVIVTEGVFDAMTFAECGVEYAFSLPNGANSVKKARAAVKALAECESVVIATDGDEAGDKAAAELVTLLFEAGQECVLRVSYPSGTKDANEVLLRDGPEAVRDLVVHATPCFPPHHPAHWSDTFGTEEDERPWIIGGLLRQGQRVVVHGAPESFKSTAAFQVALAYLSSPETEQALGGLPITSRGRVLILNEETRKEELHEVLLEIAAGMGMPDGIVAEWIESRRLTTVSQSGLLLPDAMWLKRLNYVLASEQPCLVVIDSWRHLISDFEENTSRGLTVLRGLDQLLKNGPHTLLVIAHESKSAGGKAGKGLNAIAGSNTLGGWVDVGVRFVRKPRSSRVGVEITKGRRLKEVPPPFEVVVEALGAGRRLVPVTARSSSPFATASPGSVGGPGAVVLSSLARELLGALQGPLVCKAVTRNDLRKAIGKPRLKYPRMEDALQELESIGLVVRAGSPKLPRFQSSPAPEAGGLAPLKGSGDQPTCPPPDAQNKENPAKNGGNEPVSPEEISGKS